MVDDRIFEVRSHTHTHKKFHKKDNYLNLADELILSKNIIKKNLGIDPISFAWPLEDFDENKLEIAKKCGYKMIFTTRVGSMKKGFSPFVIRRINILPHRDIIWFKKRLKLHNTPIISDIYTYVYGLDGKIKKFFKKKKNDD